MKTKELLDNRDEAGMLLKGKTVIAPAEAVGFFMLRNGGQMPVGNRRFEIADLKKDGCWDSGFRIPSWDRQRLLGISDSAFLIPNGDRERA